MKVRNKEDYRELLRYIAVGGSVTMLNLLIYHIGLFVGIDYKVANLTAIISSKVYGYIANKKIVFKSHCNSFTDLVFEILKFIGARGFTGVLDYFGLLVIVEFLEFDKIGSKYIIQAIVIVVNYILGKFFVFKGKGKAVQKYNTGNFDKYMTHNPLKRYMVQRFNIKILDIIKDLKSKSTYQELNILDAGCGEGFIDRILQDNINGLKITGVEYTDEAIDIAKDLNPEVNYIQGDIYQLPFEDNSFDIVICTEVLEHLDYPEIAIKELDRVAKHSILITVPHEPWFCMGNVLVFKNLSRLGNPIDHINHWTAKSFSKFVNRIIGKHENDTSFPWLIVWKNYE